MTDTEMTTEQWLAIRKAEALLIDPATAEVTWDWVRIMDPYGVRDLPSEMQCVGRVYFARRPGSTIWVSFYDLPDETRAALWDKPPIDDDEIPDGPIFHDPRDEAIRNANEEPAT
jgi:hypothetical protein